MTADLTGFGLASGLGLAEPLARAIEQVLVSADGRSAAVGGREIEASGPAELTPRLARAIYDVLHVGRPAEPASRDGGRGSSPRASRAAKPDYEFEARLLAAVPHRTVVRTGRLLAVRPDEILAEVEEVRVRLPRLQGTLPRGLPPAPGSPVAVTLPSARPALSPGYFVVDSTRPLHPGQIFRVYVQVSEPDALLEAWQLTLADLEGRRLAYRAKAVSRPRLLPRSDALVVYLGERHLAIARNLAGTVSGLADGTAAGSVFTEPITPGVTLAWEPADPRPRMRGLSFGEHRALATTEGLVAHAQAGGGPDAAESVRRSFITARIDPAHPARNLPPSGPADSSMSPGRKT